MLRLLGAGSLGALIATGTAGGVEYTRFEPLSYVIAVQAEQPGACNRLALMNIPSGWQSGDAAVLLLTEAALRDPLRDRLVATLLQTGAAVVEAVTGAGARCAGGDAEETEAETSWSDPLAVLFAVLEAARIAGAGLVVAVGYGPGGDAVLDAVREDVAALGKQPVSARFAAAAALGTGQPAFALGAPMPASEAAPMRLGLFCAALDHVLGGLGEAARAGAEHGGEACRAALAPGLHAPPRRGAAFDR